MYLWTCQLASSSSAVTEPGEIGIVACYLAGLCVLFIFRRFCGCWVTGSALYIRGLLLFMAKETALSQMEKINKMEGKKKKGSCLYFVHFADVE